MRGPFGPATRPNPKNSGPTFWLRENPISLDAALWGPRLNLAAF